MMATQNWDASSAKSFSPPRPRYSLFVSSQATRSIRIRMIASRLPMFCRARSTILWQTKEATWLRTA